ncbi:type II toxin-antitoxin system VapC family toxin [Acidobacterium sp. S8]|uniref:type II toxin-antitoxin system VapC family toxin n=1 Tax=Acidobacterium sp. S8 TaxID=1641854 RepID=UPI00131AA18C|nr:type II toxin-antitoxin system VapC family toxin [Acidobacterium sp. S8]
MNLLLDTHALLWTVTGDPKLSRRADSALHDEDSDIYVSAASAWEIATKFRLGKLPEGEILIEDFDQSLNRLGFIGLPISIDHAQRAGLLPGSHKDPFDRLLIAQAQAENLVLVSNERVFDGYGVRRLW